jgi:predicted ATPase
VSRFGLKAQSAPAFLSLLLHERTTVIEMTGLNEVEVREVLLHTLKVDHISQNLVDLVFDVSSGNAYWCKAIANFIKERGVSELEEAIQKGDSPHNALKVLILLRMEKLDIDQQIVLKNAAIIGDEFSEKMLLNILPARIQQVLPESLDVLAEHGFIFCVQEHPESIFGFQNDLIRGTLYELMPPR